MVSNLQGKRAVVIGGASGIGRATALLLAQLGAGVVIGDVNKAAADAVAAEVGGAAIEIDLVSPESITAFAATLVRQTPRLDVLVNCAGWNKVQPFLESTPDLWSRVLAINLQGTIQLVHSLLPLMIEGGGGKVINIASDAGRVGSRGEVVYSAAKGGLIGFTKALAREVASKNVQVNCVCPGPTDTPLLHAAPPKMQEALIKAIPLKRLARPEEIAEAIAFFAQSGSSYITGQVLSVSGGLTMSG